MDELRVELKGEAAKLGTVPAADVARLILLIEKAAARAAAVVLGKPKTSTGRYRGIIEQAVDFRLRAVEDGSVVPVLELPGPPTSDHEGFEMEVISLAESAMTKLLEAAGDPNPDSTVAKALLDVADGMGIGDRYEEIVFKACANGRPARQVRIDATVRKNLRTYVESAPAAPKRSDAVMGVLVEADFEKRTARLRTPTERGVEVEFPEELDDDIYAALRQPATLRGEVVYDPKLHSAKSIHLRQVDRGEQLILGLDPGEFWSAPSFEELAHEQNAGRPADPEALYDPEVTEDEREAFMAALAELS